ncbi:hypothetical protein AALB16_15785 [Lachnospiraceae bacterium 62-35]
MSNYSRLISYIYAYEGEVKGKNIGFAKLEARNGQCKINVNVKRVYVGSNDLQVYLLSSSGEIGLGKIFIRNGSGEFRASVNVNDAEGSGVSMDQCYGLTIHDPDSTWQSYTTIWEDAVAQAAEIELARVTADNIRKKEKEKEKRQEKSSGQGAEARPEEEALQKEEAEERKREFRKELENVEETKQEQIVPAEGEEKEAQEERMGENVPRENTESIETPQSSEYIEETEYVQEPEGINVTEQDYQVESQEQKKSFGYQERLEQREHFRPFACPGRPGRPPHPGQPGRPPHPGEPGKPPYPGEPGRPSHPGGPGRPPHPGEPGRPPHPGGPGRPPHPGGPGRPPHPGGPGRPPHPGGPGRPPHPGGPGRPPHPGGPGRPSHPDYPRYMIEPERFRFSGKNQYYQPSGPLEGTQAGPFHPSEKIINSEELTSASGRTEEIVSTPIMAKPKEWVSQIINEETAAREKALEERMAKAQPWERQARPASAWIQENQNSETKEDMIPKSTDGYREQNEEYNLQEDQKKELAKSDLERAGWNINEAPDIQRYNYTGMAGPVERDDMKTDNKEQISSNLEREPGRSEIQEQNENSNMPANENTGIQEESSNISVSQDNTSAEEQEVPLPEEPAAEPENTDKGEGERDYEMLWDRFQKEYPKVRAFDYENGCEILSINPQDIGLLPRENWVYGNNSFLLHGYYSYRYLILVRLHNPKGKPRFLLGVPGHYFSNEKRMASMFGFPHFVLSKNQPVENGRFGYWYTDVKLGNDR